MTISQQLVFLEEVFGILNEKYFESALPEIAITIQSSPRANGHLEKRGLLISRAEGIGYSITKPSDEIRQLVAENGWAECITLYREIYKPNDKSDGSIEIGKIGGAKKPSSTRKYQCPLCGMSVRATKSVAIEAVKGIIEQDELIRDSSDVTSLFVNQMYVWVKRCHFSSAVDIRNIEEIIASQINANNVADYILYDEQYLYLSESLFKQIVEPLRKFVPINIIKGSLKESGVIIADTNSYVSKVTINICSGVIRPRMIRILRGAIDSPGELSLVDECLIMKEAVFDE